MREADTRLLRKLVLFLPGKLDVRSSSFEKRVNRLALVAGRDF